MEKNSQPSGRNSRPSSTLAEMPFRELVQTDPELRKLREEYCAGRNGRKEEAVTHARRAVDLEPQNCRLLSDLGYSLIESRQYEEAEQTLRRAVDLAPADYTLPAGNLEYLTQIRTKAVPE